MKTQTFRVLEGLAFAIALVGVALVARNDAGLAGPWVLIGLVSVVPLYVVGRGWRLPWWLHLGAAWLPTAVVLASAIHGYGDGASRASRYAYGAMILLAVIAWARDPARRLIVASAVVLLAADGYLTAWWIWWGSGDAIKTMFGNYYTQNVFATSLVLGAAVAIVLVVAGRRVFVFVGFVVACLTGAGILASGSRAGFVLLLVALLAGFLLGIVARGWRGAVRAAIVAVAIPCTAWFMAGPVFFPNSDGFFAVARRVEDPGASFAGRVSFWLDAARLGAEAPFAGHGLKSFGPLLQCLDSDWYSSNAHNEPLLAWAETGIIGFLPFLAMGVGVILIVVRTLGGDRVHPRRVRWIPSSVEVLEDPARWGALVSLILAMVHVCFDFDWAYPAIIGLTALVAGTAAAPLVASRSRGRTVVILNGALVLAIIGAAVAGFAIDPLPAESLRPIPLGWIPCAP